MGNSPIVSRINGLLAEKGISKRDFYKDCGITSASYSLWNTGKTTPRMKNLEIIAEYLGTTTDYLLTGLGEKEKAPILTKKDERDIEKRLAEVLADLEGNQDGLMFSGEAMDETTRELLAASLRNSMEIGKTLAKQKFTPKKYRKEG